MSEEPIDELDARRRRRADIEAVPEPPFQGLLRPPAAEEPGDAETIEVEPTRTVYVDITSVERVPIIPPSLHGWNNIRATVRDTLRGWLRITATLAFRSPMYAVKATGWAVVGAIRIAGRQLRWWWSKELAPAPGDPGDIRLKANRAMLRSRRNRGLWILAEITSGALVVLVLLWVAPWALPLVAAATIPFLAHVGRPVDRPIITEITIGPKFTRLTAEMVRQALVDLGLTGLKDPKQVTFPPPGVHREGPGWLARVDLPRGVEAVKVLERRDGLSSALRLPVDQVWPSVGPDHAGQVDLWVGYQPASKMGKPPWSLASPTARTSVFEPFEFGTDPRQRPVSTTLFARNFLIGGVPGSGKSYAARALALGAALDPLTELKIAEFKGTADFADLAHLCSTYVCGINGQALTDGAEIIRWGLAEAERRGRRIAKARERGLAPEGKVTPELAARPGSGLHPVVMVIDEAHELLCDKQVADAAEKLIKRGRALGLILILATQIPDAKSVPPNITRCVTIRWCLAVGAQIENDMILGTGAYKRGLSATAYRPGEDAGWGIVVGLSEPGPVHSHFPTPEEAARIVARATALRGGAVVGSGIDPQQRRDILDDVATIFVASERGAHWETLAERLAVLDPAYSGITAEVVSARLRALGVPSVDVKAPGARTPKKGAKREAITEAIDRRTLESGQK